jgi:hypothetical protein
LDGPTDKGNMGGSSVVAGADLEEPSGQHVGPASGPRQPADYKEASSEVRITMLPHEKLMLV